MATFKAVIFDNHIKQDNTTNIKIRIYHNKSSQYIPTPYYIHPREMGRDGNILSICEHSDVFNVEISNMLQKFRSICIKLGSDRISRMKCSEIKTIIEESLSLDSEHINFVEFSQSIINSTEKEKTADWYQSAIKSLCWFYGSSDIDVRDITGVRMNEFMHRLSVDGINGRALEPGAISNYLRAIRSLYNKAKMKYNNEDYNIIRIPNDPFSRVKIPKYRRTRKSLSIQDIIRIRDGVFSTERANMARDVFMIMFYLMGININDLYKLKRLIKGRVEYERSKTITEDNIYRFPLSIKIEPELNLLITKYSKLEIFSFFRARYSCLNNFMRAVNKGLSQISDELNLGVKVTTNWARHSWASIARNKALVPKADIDFCLGHVNNDYKMADIYIDVDYSIYDITNRKVLDLLIAK